VVADAGRVEAAATVSVGGCDGDSGGATSVRGSCAPVQAAMWLSAAVAQALWLRLARGGGEVRRWSRVTSDSGGEASAAWHRKCGGSALVRLAWLWCRYAMLGACSPGHGYSGRKPTPSVSWWNDGDVLNVTLLCFGCHLELHLGCTWSLSENPVLMLDEQWWRSWRRTLLEGIVS
jgi:hypothetical protein